MPSLIIVHERLADWTGWLRPRFASNPTIRWVESRSVGDLTSAAAGSSDPIALINLAARPYWGLEGLDALNQIAPNALTLVLDPNSTPTVPIIARELGATLVWSGVVVPPRVEALIHRWLTVLEQRQIKNKSVIAGRSNPPVR